MSWFRLHDEVVGDPKVQRLAPVLFKTWINLLCLASKYGGKLPAIEDIAFALRLRVVEAQERVDALISAELLERDGDSLCPHNWNGRQYKSDVSTERVKQFRKRKGNVSETPPEQRQSRTETEQREDAQALPPVVLARKVVEELQLRGPGIIPAIGGAIAALVAEGKAHNSAVEFLIAHGKDAIDRGETVNRFWFDDSKWRTPKQPVSRREQDLEAQMDIGRNTQTGDLTGEDLRIADEWNRRRRAAERNGKPGPKLSEVAKEMKAMAKGAGA